MPNKRTSDISSAPTRRLTHLYCPFLVSRARGRKVEGKIYLQLTYGNFNEHDCQILTTNNKTPREAITKEKLALEVAKLVNRCIEDIKVRTTFVFFLLFSKPTSG